MEGDQVPYNPPQQKRSRESMQRLLDAAEERIAAVGTESLTIADVVAQADLSVGAFYARFPDKTSLLRAVQARFHDRVEPVLRAEMLRRGAEAANLAEAIDRLLDVLLGHMVSTRELSRAFMMSSVFDPEMRVTGSKVNRARREVFASVLLAHREEIGHTDPSVAIAMAYGLYAAVVRGTMVFGLHHELHQDIADPIIASEIKRALTLYLRG